MNLFISPNRKSSQETELGTKRGLRTEIFSVQCLTKQHIQQRLRVSITDTCNFKCFFCHNEGQGDFTSSSGYMSVSEITKMVEIAVKCGVQAIKLTGGEPLIYRHKSHNVVDLVASIINLKKQGLNFTLSLITNGYLLKDFSKELFDAGLNGVNISLSTLNEKTFHNCIVQNDKSSISNVVQGIEAAVSTGLKPVKVNTVVFYSTQTKQGNLTEIPEIIQLCKRVKVDELRLYTLLWHPEFISFNEYYHFWDSAIFSSIEFLDCENIGKAKEKLLSSLQFFVKEWSSIVYPKARMVIKCGDLPVAFESMKLGRFGQGSPCENCNNLTHCQEGPYAIRASATGKLRGCLLSNNSVDFLGALRAGASDEELKCLYRSSFSLLPMEGEQ